MAYIQVCPQMAKSIFYYATTTPQACAKNEWIGLTWHRFIDGSQKEDAETTKMTFDRLGDYKVTATMKFDQEYVNPDLSGRGDHALWTESQSKNTVEGWWRFTGILHAIIPSSAEFDIKVDTSCQLLQASFVIEYQG